MVEKIDNAVPKIEFPGTKPLDGKAEIPQALIGLAQENQQKLQEIQKNVIPSIISEKAKNKIVKTVRAVLAAGMVGGVAVPLAACKSEAVVEKQVTAPSGQETASPSTTVEQTTTTVEPTTTTEAEIINAPERAGLTFDQETKSYFNEARIKVGVYVEDAVKIDGKMEDAVGLAPEEIQKILNENKEKGIFECPWPFDFQKNKGIEAVELFNNPLYEQKVFEKYGVQLDNNIGIKYSEPIDFYASFDVGKSMGYVDENIPDKKGPDFYSAQPIKSLGLRNKSFGGLQYDFIDWESKLKLSKAENFKNEAYLQDTLEDLKCGDFLGKILPNTADFNFLDFVDNKDFYENPGQFQGRLLITTISQDFSKKSSSLEKMLKLGKGNQEIPVFVWPGENTAHEQTN